LKYDLVKLLCGFRFNENTVITQGNSGREWSMASPLKKYFLLDPKITYLNHGSFGATPKPVFKEYQRWQRELENQPVEFLGRRIAGLLAESRAALGEYLGTHADNLIYTQNVTISLNTVANSLSLGAGDEVLASDHEYGAMNRTWNFLSRERGFQYVNQAVKLTSHADFIDSFWQGVTARTRVIFLSHITSPTAII
jgi:isopenicillin-N epimerase